MKMGSRQRWVILALLMGLTLAAVVWVGQDEDQPVAVQPKKNHVATKAHGVRMAAVKKDEGSSNILNMEKLQRTPMAESDNELFAAKSWYVPPPPPPTKPISPPPPTAPPLPFVYMGKLIEDGQQVVFLSKQERNYVVKRGDTLDNTYRVDEINGRVMNLTYLPMNIKQTLMIGGET